MRRFLTFTHQRNKKGGACGKYGGGEVHAGFLVGNLENLGEVGGY